MNLLNKNKNRNKDTAISTPSKKIRKKENIGRVKLKEVFEEEVMAMVLIILLTSK